ncbi:MULTISPECIES: SDR family oxidoreductase [Cupriavidus]|uniref:NAD-dependent epimerase/dehydratase:Short-chain dehydrogenase/reductase SDR n=1 Tax=Cupriavidus pinatubonensis (strain JMP 134 / LMG 1197) TaxID=264198 RepID=Q46MU1_CUPPJ|nr:MULTISPECIES: SDR family oxidoreductase [Cupriavidus]QYY33898.1 SDR family oxidoreductase [Cupriavidus pinatubonensis]
MKERVLVTGGADSVGRVIAELFRARGALVHICDVREDALAETLRANPGMTGTVANVGRPDEVAKVVRDAERHFGDISVLVNNVGIAGPRAAIEDISDEAWRETLDVNVGAMFQFMKRVVPAMKRRRHGAIINFSTGSTRTRLPMRTPYVVSKAAVESLTLNAARELGPFNVRCNAILPGMIDNERMQRIVANIAQESGRAAEEVESDYLKYISLRSKVQPEDLAQTVLFLASDAASKITGELLAVSGNVEWEI